MGRITLSISEDLEQFIDGALARGRFGSAQELVLEAVTRMKETEVSEQQLDEIRRKIDEGYDQAVRGELVDSSSVRGRLAEMSAAKRSAR